MATNPLTIPSFPADLRLNEPLVSDFAIRLAADGSLAAVDWIESKPLERGSKHIVDRCSYYLDTFEGKFRIGRAKTATDAQGQPLPLATLEALRLFRALERTIEKPKQAGDQIETFADWSAVPIDLARTVNQHDHALPLELQKASLKTNYQAGLARAGYALDPDNDFKDPVLLNEEGLPVGYSSLPVATVARAQTALQTPARKPGKAAIIRAETATLCGTKMQLQNVLLVAAPDSPQWLHLASEDDDPRFKQQQDVGYGGEQQDGYPYYKGIMKDKRGNVKAILIDRVYDEYYSYPERKRSEASLRRKLWIVEDFNAKRDKMSNLDQAAIPPKKLRVAEEQALLAFEKLKASQEPFLGTAPIRRSLVGRAVDWAYENLP